ncbi:MAG: GNAT family N-acetyltransferase [Bacteroidaceae bacterium]|nr:GNAT family N-acetyltransferase [Bacteroidaceae bacterium]
MIKCVTYSPSYALHWDQLVQQSRNATFMLQRQYMDYHQDRFTDASLVFVDHKGHFVALLPANIDAADGIVYSHQGLTYGGLIMSTGIRTEQIGEAIDKAISYYRHMGARKLIYKPTPYIYNKYPSQEDLYYLFRHGARLHSRSLSQTIYLPQAIGPNTLRRRKLNQSLQAGNRVDKTTDVTQFWHILDHTLQTRHNVRPVHSIDQLHLLMSRFPSQICLYQTLDPHDQVLAGTLVYDCGQTIHTQYLAASDRGREVGALDQVLSYLITDIYADRQYFDFGISTESGGKILNLGLTMQKESFGGRGVCYDTWELNLL